MRYSMTIEGELFQLTVETEKGVIDVLAEEEIDGKLLTLKDMTIFPRSPRPLTGLTKDILAARSYLMKEVRDLGFDNLRITGKRLESSTSTNPGHTVDLVIDLTG